MRVLCVLCLFALAGCVHDAQYGIVERSSWRMLEKLTVTRDTVYQKNSFTRCVGLHARNGAPLQKWQAPKDKAVISEDRRTVQIEGGTRWQFALTQRYMTFHLTAQQFGQRFYTFENVKSDIWPVAASSLEGRAALQALVDVVDAIEQCQRDLDGGAR